MPSMTIRRIGLIGLAMSLVVGLLAATPTPSLAWRAGVFVGPGAVVGPPVVIAPPVYVTPAPVIVETAPPVYQEQPQPQAAQQYWYYCQDPQGYYPYVQQCPRGWQPVSPTPGSGR
jgi:hypothetical protein